MRWGYPWPGICISAARLLPEGRASGAAVADVIKMIPEMIRGFSETKSAAPTADS